MERRVNILKLVRTPDGWRRLALSRNSKGRIRWDTLPGTYVIEWRENGRRVRKSAGLTPSEALEEQKKKRLELEAGERGIKLSFEQDEDPLLLSNCIEAFVEDIKAADPVLHTDPKLLPCPKGAASEPQLSLLQCSASVLFSYVRSVILTDERFIHFQLRRDSRRSLNSFRADDRNVPSRFSAYHSQSDPSRYLNRFQDLLDVASLQFGSGVYPKACHLFQSLRS
jgi:hypothetical protein